MNLMRFLDLNLRFTFNVNIFHYLIQDFSVDDTFFNSYGIFSWIWNFFIYAQKDKNFFFPRYKEFPKN